MSLATLRSLHAESQVFLLGHHQFEWQQPASISDRFPELISTKHWQFDYETTEQLLLKIKPSKTGELILNRNAAKVLEQAVSELPLDMKQDDLQRLALLVAKGLPGKAGRQLASVLTNYYQFYQASNIVSSSANTPPNTVRNTHNEERSFQQTVLRQEYYLGKTVTQQLFGRQNALTHYLYARRHINENSSLNPDQKQRQLATLQDRFKDNDE